MQTFFASTHPKIAVLCSSSPPRRSCYVEDAELLGSYLAAAPFSLLYGGLGFGLGSRLTKRFSAIDCLPSRLVDRPEFCSYVFGL